MTRSLVHDLKKPESLLSFCASPASLPLTGYLGFLVNFFSIATSELSLSRYKDTDNFLAFIAYLKKRGVGRDHLAKHVTICKRVCKYLDKDVRRNDSAQREQSKARDEWLGTLQCQLKDSMPKATRTEMPSALEVYRHVDVLTKRATQAVAHDTRAGGVISSKTAFSVQVALLAMLVTGSELPPCR